MYAAYRWLTALIAPVAPVLLRRRLARGKEDPARLRERLGYPSRPRPAGALVWLHAASVGESLSLLPLIHSLHGMNKQVLITTGTVTSARLLQPRLPAGVIHQFVPLDVPQAVRRFIDHWRPDMALWAESELWPNLVMQCRRGDCHMALVNARISQRSFKGWQRMPSLIRRMLRCFDAVFAQTEGDAMRLRALGAQNVRIAGNLKFDAAPLACDETALAMLKQQIGPRPVWLAASTHAGEETLIAQAHDALKPSFPSLLTIIAPRHASRGDAVAEALAGRAFSMRSRGEAIDAPTEFYLADTMGELGLFYRLSSVAFLGGSLVPHGGQNPLEAIRLGCAVVTGPYTHNFAQMIAGLEQVQGVRLADDAAAVAESVRLLLQDAPAREAQARRAAEWLEMQSGATSMILDSIRPLLAEPS